MMDMTKVLLVSSFECTTHNLTMVANGLAPRRKESVACADQERAAKCLLQALLGRQPTRDEINIAINIYTPGDRT